MSTGKNRVRPPVLAQLRGVSKSFLRGKQTVSALDDVNFTLRAGTLVGLFGNNGAGKTTLSRLLTGTLNTDHGQIHVCGHDLRSARRAAQSCTGLCAADERSFYPRLTGLENLRLFGALRGIRGAALRLRIEALSEPLQISRASLERPFQTLSSGERQRLNLARGMLHEPALLVVDEALRSADPKTMERVSTLLQEYVHGQQRAVLYTGHEFHGVEDLCDEIAVLHRGKLLVHGKQREVLSLAEPGWRLQFEQGVAAQDRSSRVTRERAAKCLLDRDSGLRSATLERHSQVRELLIELANSGPPTLPPPALASEHERIVTAPPPPPPRASTREVLVALLRRDRSIYFSHRFQLIVQAGTMALWAGLFFFATRLVAPSSPQALEQLHGDFFSYVLFGLAFLQLGQVCLVHMGNALREEQIQGTLEVMLGGCNSPLLLLIGSLGWPLLMSLASMGMLLLAGSLFFGMNLALAWWPGLLLATALSALVFTCLGVISASFVLYFKRGDPIAKILGLAALLVGNTYFPVETLPAWLRPFGDLHPMTHGLRAARLAALQGSSFGTREFTQAIGVLAGMALVLAPLALWAYRKALHQARQQGGLGHA